MTWSGSAGGAHRGTRRRLEAARTVRRLAAEPGDYKAIAGAARERHRAGTLTLVVLNTVEAARSVSGSWGRPVPNACCCIPGSAAWSARSS